MPWFTIDDSFHSHPKTLGVSFEAIGVWTKCGSWCSEHLTNGSVPEALLRAWSVRDEVAVELVSAGLWGRTETGYQFHDWLEYQQSREDVLAKRAEAKERMRKARAKKVRANKSRTPPEPDPNKPRSSHNPSPSPSPSPSPELRTLSLARDEQSLVQIGSDLLTNATGLFYGGPQWRSQLELIGVKPEPERRAVLAAISCDPWCKENKHRVDPDHVLKHWLKYAAGNPPLKSVARAQPTAAEPTEAAKLAAKFDELVRAERACLYDEDEKKKRIQARKAEVAAQIKALKDSNVQPQAKPA